MGPERDKEEQVGVLTRVKRGGGGEQRRGSDMKGRLKKGLGARRSFDLRRRRVEVRVLQTHVHVLQIVPGRLETGDVDGRHVNR